MLKTVDLHKSFGDLSIKGINTEIHKGEVVAIIGPFVLVNPHLLDSLESFRRTVSKRKSISICSRTLGWYFSILTYFHYVGLG